MRTGATRAILKRLFFSSWPDLIRPSTLQPAATAGVDARVKPGHDAIFASAILLLAMFALFRAGPSAAMDWPQKDEIWGFSVDELDDLFREMATPARRLDPPIDYGVGKAKLFIDSIEYGGVRLKQFYLFDEQDRLIQILHERRDSGATRAAFDAIDRDLRNEYGQPNIACERKQGIPRTIERRWIDEKTAAHLSYFDFTGQAMTLDPNRDATNPLVPSYVYEPMKPRSFPRRIVLRLFPASNKQLAGQPACHQPPLRQ